MSTMKIPEGIDFVFVFILFVVVVVVVVVPFSV